MPFLHTLFPLKPFGMTVKSYYSADIKIMTFLKYTEKMQFFTFFPPKSIVYLATFFL